MLNATLKALDAPAQAIFDQLTRDLDTGDARKIDNAKGVFMAVSVDRLTERHYSIAHNYVQNGDLMADPDMTFFKAEDGHVYACTFQQDNLGVYRVGLEVTPEGVIEEENTREQNNQAEFANEWMQNIADQQQLPCTSPAEDSHE